MTTRPSFTVRTDRALARARSGSTRYVLARIVAPRAEQSVPRQPVAVSLVLDRSGSMDGERKFSLAREAVKRALSMLTAEDRFSIVVYDDQIDVLASACQATDSAKRDALGRLDAVEPRGGTDLGGGWLHGCEQVADDRDAFVRRVLLLTDGLANTGITDRDELALHAGELRQRLVSTSTFGVGADFDERLLRDMAHEGGGNSYFIEGAAQIPAMVASELGEALEVTLRNATVVIEVPEGVTVEPLTRHRFVSEAQSGRRTVRVDVGDLISSQEMTVVLRVALPAGSIGSEVRLGLSLLGDNANLARESATFTYASHHDNDVQRRDREVDREVAGIYAARARAEATEHNRVHDLNSARRVLESTARRIKRYAGTDGDLLAIAQSLNDEIPMFAEQLMSPMVMKSNYYMAEARQKSRGPSGQAQRRTQ